MSERARAGTGPIDIVSETQLRRGMRRFRRHLQPLQGESMSPIDLPPMRSGLLAKLNLLTIGLTAFAALVLSGYYLWQQWQGESRELKQRGQTVLAVLADVAEFGVYTSDRASLEQALSGLASDPDVAYAIVLDPRLKPIAERRFGAAPGNEPLPPLPADVAAPKAGETLQLAPTMGGRR